MARAQEKNKRALLTREEWRARRELRREKQRKDNIHRAAKMHTARLKSANDSPKRPPQLKQSINVGCSGWRYWKWRVSFYDGVPQNDWFEHYLKRFDTVEINASFYSWPTVAAVQAWRRQPGRKKFVYTVKVCELITHIKKFKGTKTLVKDFGMIADILGTGWAVFCFSFRRATATPRLASMTSSASSITRAATSSNFGTPAGGMTRFTAPFARRESYSAHAAGQDCRTSSSGARTKYMSGCTVPSAGIATTIQRRNWRSGRTGLRPAEQKGPGSTSTTTMKPMRRKTPPSCGEC